MDTLNWYEIAGIFLALATPIVGQYTVYIIFKTKTNDRLHVLENDCKNAMKCLVNIKKRSTDFLTVAEHKEHMNSCKEDRTYQIKKIHYDIEKMREDIEESKNMISQLLALRTGDIHK